MRFPVLLCVQFVEPVFHVAQRSQQAQPRLCQVESRIHCILKLLPLFDAGQLLGLGSQLGR